jgi:DNA-binding GntR family transcriptional regulator
MTDRSTVRPLYEQLADTLKQQIDTGEYGAGDWLPSEREISELHDVSRNTVRLALQSLVSDGVLEAKPSRGYVVPATDEPVDNGNELREIRLAIARIEDRLDRLERQRSKGR